MVDTSGDRAQYFPAIERQHGGPITMWLERLADLGDAKYPEQIAYLRENHGFSRTHANALVMYARSSPSSKRFRSPDDYFSSLDPAAATTARAIFSTIMTGFSELDLVIAWNQPMLRSGAQYVLGLSTAKQHLLLNPFSADVLTKLADRLAGYHVNKRTVRVPVEWEIDEGLLHAITAARLAELA